MGPVKVKVSVPSLLAHCTAGQRQIEIMAATLEDCFSGLTAGYPLLDVHLFDETRTLRAHVNVFHNETNVKWLEDWRIPLQDGDTLTVLQAVSGG